MRLLIKQGKLIDNENKETTKDVFIDYGEIMDIKDSFNEDTPEYINANDNYLIPGLIDVNCKICDPGYEYMEDVASVSKSAAKGGFTSITASPDTNPVIDDKTVVKYIEHKSKRLSLINIYQYGSMTKAMEGKEIAEIGEMQKAGIVAISDGGKSISDANLMNNILRYSIMFNIPVITFCDDESISAGGVINSGDISTITGLGGIKREAEEIITARNVILAKHSGARIHIQNVSTKESVEIIRQAKKDGIKVTCDTCPHYFTLSDECLNSYNTLFKVRPPLRTQQDIEAITEGLFDGTIDIISSGHSPVTIEQKQVEFDRASYGISSLETTFLLSYNYLVEENKMDFSLLIDKFTKNPAKLLGLKSKGKIEIGYDADLFLFDKEAKTLVNSKNFASKAKFSPYDNQTFIGEIMFTVVGGKVTYLKN